MKGVYLILIVLLAFPVLAEDSVKYGFKVSENGETTALIFVEGKETLKLPQDVTNPQVSGGSYKITEEGIIIISKVTKASLAYQSSFHTKKEDGVWFFDVDVVKGGDVTLILPGDIQIVKAKPSAFIEKGETTKLIWNSAAEEKISVSYLFLKTEIPLQKQEEPVSPALIILLGAATLILGGGSFLVLRKGKATRAANISDGQMNIVKAANPNNAKILTILLKHNGHIKRNVLERESEISKSSLASALKSLEKKNLVNVDRSFHVHYITLTDWFKEL